MAVINSFLSEFSHSNMDPITTSTHQQSSTVPTINFAPPQLICSLNVGLDTFLQNPQNGWTCTCLEKQFKPSNSKNGNIINRSLNYSSEPLPFAARRSSSRRCCSNCFCWRFSASRDGWFHLMSLSLNQQRSISFNHSTHCKFQLLISACKSQLLNQKPFIAAKLLLSGAALRPFAVVLPPSLTTGRVMQKVQMYGNNNIHIPHGSWFSCGLNKNTVKVIV